MTTIELNAALKRLKAISDSVIDLDEKMTELSSTLSDCAGKWSQSFTPVDGWEAIPRTIGNEDSFCVIKCPKFVED